MFNYNYIIAVALGAILGALLRWGITLVTLSIFGNALLGTLGANLLGCFLWELPMLFLHN